MKKKGEFESPRNESLCFKQGNSIMLRPFYIVHNIYIVPINCTNLYNLLSMKEIMNQIERFSTMHSIKMITS